MEMNSGFVAISMVNLERKGSAFQGDELTTELYGNLS